MGSSVGLTRLVDHFYQQERDQARAGALIVAGHLQQENTENPSELNLKPYPRGTTPCLPTGYLLTSRCKGSQKDSFV